MNHGDNYIAGEWVEGAAAVSERHDPGSLDVVVGSASDADPAQVERALNAAVQAQTPWASLHQEQRCDRLRNVVDHFESQASDVASIISRETGKLESEALGEVRSTIADARYQIDIAQDVALGAVPELPPPSSGPSGVASRSPLGLVLAVTPWNFPVATIFRKLIPALAYGNTVIVKPSELSPLSAALSFVSVAEGGLPSGTAQLVQGPGATVGTVLTADHRVDGITFTGSTKVGTQIAVSTATTNTRLQLELGGKNAVIVLDDADLESAAEAVVSGAFAVAGQWCTGTSRVIADSKIHDGLVARIVELAARIQVGSARSATSGMGPVISEGQRKGIGAAIAQASERGGGPAVGGRLVDVVDGHRGYFVEPTVFVNVDPDDPLAQTEVFGPVLATMKANSPVHAAQIANGTGYGLAMSVFSKNATVAKQVVRNVQAGLCHINLPTYFRQPHLPLGGWKNSGRGTPECGDLGAEAFTRLRAIYSQ